MTTDKFRATRIRVLRRVAYGLNTLALREGRVPPEGPFDAAAANGLAAIIAHEHPGAERYKSGRTKYPTELLEYVRERQAEARAAAEAQQPVTEAWALLFDVELLNEGVLLSQPFRHGRADDEWMHVSDRHIEALVKLDEHPALQVLLELEGKTFDEAVLHAFADEIAEYLPFEPGEPPPSPGECPECWRETMVSQDWDPWGIYPGEGVCIACGYERTYENSVEDYLAWRLERTD